MADEESKRHARQVLEAQGFEVRDIPEVSNAKRADLLARYRQERYVVEAKGKRMTEEYNLLLRDANDNGSAFLGRELRQWSALSAVLQEAEEQLAETASDGDLRVAWLSCLHPDASYVLSAFRKRLLGLRKPLIWEYPGPRPTEQRLCFYYDFNDLYRYRGIDIAFLAQAKGAQMIVNEFSERAELVRTSRLYELWSAHGALIDPPVAEREHGALAIRAPIDRTDPKAQWQYINDNYGLQTTVGTELEVSTIILVPRGQT